MALVVMNGGEVAVPACTDSAAPRVKNSWGSVSGVFATPGPLVWVLVDGPYATVVGATVVVVDLGPSRSSVLPSASVSITWCNEIG